LSVHSITLGRPGSFSIRAAPAGVRLPSVAAPVATTTGWGLRGAAFGNPDGCESSGQWVPFATTAAQRVANVDPRPSLQERYGTNVDYVSAVTNADNALKAPHLLLDADVQAYINAAQASKLLP
jgi:hypothetical protein